MLSLNMLSASAAVALSLAAHSPVVSSADIKIVAEVNAIKMAGDGKSAEISLTNRKGGAEIVVNAADSTTLDMIKDKRIGSNDKVRVTFDDASGKNLVKSLKKAAGA